MARANAQNNHILNKLRAVQNTVSQLVEAGLTITAVAVEGTTPQISLMHAPGKRCRLQFTNVCSRTRSGENGIRVSETTVRMNGCDVRWRDW